MKRYWVLWAALFAVGLTAGVVLAAMAPGGPGGPGGGRPHAPPPGDMQPGGPRPPAADQGPGEARPMGPPPPPPPLVGLLEAKLGKPLTEDQRGQVRGAAKANHEAMKQIIDAFLEKVAKIAGVTVEEVRSLIPPAPPPPLPGGRGPPPQGQATPKSDGQMPPPPGGHKPPAPGAHPPRGQGQMPPPPDGQMPQPPEGNRPPPPPPLPPLFHLGDLLIGALEAKLGKPLSPDQVDQIHAAQRAALEAAKPIHEAFVQKLAEITGLTVDEIRELLPNPPPRGPGPQGGGPRGDGPQGGGPPGGGRHGPGGAAPKKVPV